MSPRLCLALLCALAVAAPGVAAAQDEAARTGLALAKAGNCDGAMAHLRPLADAGAEAVSDAATRQNVLEAAAECDVRARKLDTAYRYALTASEARSGSDTMWQYRLAIEIDAGSIEAALLTTERLSVERPRVFNAIEPATYWKIAAAANSAGRPETRERLIAILATRYQPDDPFTSSSEMKLEYARILAGRGRDEEARQQLARISADDLIAASFDPKLRAIVGSDLNVRQIAENDLIADRELMRQYPDRLIALLRAVGSLRSVGRQQEALDLLLSARPRLTGDNAFSDASEETIWWWNALAKSYKLTGNYDEMVRSFKEGAQLDEKGGLNVSQVINLAWAQIELHRYAEAIETLKPFDGPERKLSAYGQLTMRTARACALALAGRVGDAAPDVEFILANRVNAPHAPGAVYLCLGDMDASAREAIRLLSEDLHAGGLLMSFSDYETPTTGPPPSEMTVRKAALKARPDVKKALEKAGGIRKLGIYHGSL